MRASTLQQYSTASTNQRCLTPVRDKPGAHSCPRSTCTWLLGSSADAHSPPSTSGVALEILKRRLWPITAPPRALPSMASPH
ncbi:hypothetical protein TgHK011_005058 [Trichoderma gracile]|nr:hypothetical protein TgHK011_005058 [Trichoderma gracile]